MIAFNNYPQWYNAAPTSYWNDMANAVRAGQTKSGIKGTMGKPMVISETGAGGIYEWSENNTDVKWTLKFQTGIISGDVDAAISNQNVSGITLWHLFDFKVDNCGAHWPCSSHDGSYGQENNTHCPYNHPPPTTFQELASEGPPNCTIILVNNRPGGENHKGSIDFWRREKPVFGIVAAKYKAANLVHE